MRSNPSSEPSPRRPLAARATLAALLLAAPASAQTPAQASAPAGSRIESELAGIRASLERIVDLLGAQARSAEGDVLLRRIELKTTRLVPVEERLRRVRGEMSELAAERRRVQAYSEELEERSFRAETEEGREAVTHELTQLTLMLERHEQLRVALEEEQGRLQTDQTQLAAEIDQLERELDLVQARAESRSPR
ncbi:MAG TPA: hypothetical protein VNB06_07285 [Thermoanaerobaculia bacterium]|nr:hypothetical protein [Thermoanaerobaculia bacterium]